MKLVLVLALVCGTLYLLHRLALWAEPRGWVDEPHERPALPLQIAPLTVGACRTSSGCSGPGSVRGLLVHVVAADRREFEQQQGDATVAP